MRGDVLEDFDTGIRDASEQAEDEDDPKGWPEQGMPDSEDEIPHKEGGDVDMSVTSEVTYLV